MDSIKYTGTGTLQYFFQICDVNNLTVTNMNINSQKDGIVIQGPANNILVDDITTSTGDDAFYTGGHGYYTSTPLIGDVDSVTITNWTDLHRPEAAGNSVRIQSGSWLEWASGNNYHLGDVITYNGNIYRKGDSGTETASYAPVHTLEL